MRAQPLSERAARVVREAVDRDRKLQRHRDAGWPEWALRELLRYFYGVGVLALVVIGSLQIGAMAPPSGGPEGVPLPAVALIALVFVVGVTYLAARAYLFLWAKGGWVERFLVRRGRAPPHEEDPGRDP